MASPDFSAVPAHARIRAATPLYYAEDYTSDDVPASVRGGSSLRAWNSTLIAVQDDISALALIDPHPPHRAHAILLPRGHQGRRTFGPSLGNKAHKLDLEASIVLPDGRYVAFGSGSSSLRPREVLILTYPDRSFRKLDAHDLYRTLRSNTAFAGEDLNLEGALVVDDDLWLFQRGNSAVSDNAIGRMPLDAFMRYLDGAKVPELTEVRPFPLGEIRGVPWGVTDAAQTPTGEIFAVGAAEDTDNPYDDGDILGSILVRLEGRSLADLRYQTIVILDLDGKPTSRKIEGLEYLRGDGDRSPLQFWAITDEDDEDAVSELLVIEFT